MIKTIRNMTLKELKTLQALIEVPKDYIANINWFDDDMIFQHVPVCASFGKSPDTIDQMVNDVYYGMNALWLEIEKEIKRRSERA